MTDLRLKRKSKEILHLADEVCGKMNLMSNILRPLVDGKAFPVYYEYDETVNFYRLKIQSRNNHGIHGQMYFPKALKIEPDKLLLVRSKEEEE
jgi:hypothetical protein